MANASDDSTYLTEKEKSNQAEALTVGTPWQ
jgi:hypothetical protein